MEWISVKDCLPRESQTCWVYGFLDDEGPSRYVFKATFSFYIVGRDGIERPYLPRWIYDEELGGMLELSQTSHWMPYYTPEPPEEK
jgi:hypothetical protein